jgi:hypothetical protein
MGWGSRGNQTLEALPFPRWMICLSRGECVLYYRAVARVSQCENWLSGNFRCGFNYLAKVCWRVPRQWALYLLIAATGIVNVT